MSTTDLENALAKALRELTGWPDVTVCVQSAQYGPAVGSESVTLQLQAWLKDASKGDGLPF